MIQDKIFFDEKDPTGLSYNTPFTFYGSYEGRLWSKSPSGSIKYYTQNSDLSAYATTGSNQFSGSQTVTGSLTVTGTITGTVAGTTATASYVEYTNVANKPALVSGSAQIASFGIFATTGSNGFNGNQSITGSLTVTGQVVAQTLNVQQVTSSIVYSSGSNVFGNSLANTQQFTGSVSITGSLNTSIAAFGSAASLYLVSDSGIIKSRTAAQTLSDIAALPLAGGTLTGALNGTSATFSGTINSTITNALVLSNNSSTTQYVYTSLANSVGNARYGVDNSTGGGLGTGTSANSAVFGNAGNADVDITTNNISRLKISSTGAATFSSSVTANGAKPQLYVIGDSSNGAGIFLNTLLSGTNRRNWAIFTEENIDGDFTIKCSTAAGGSPAAGNTRLAILLNGNVGIGIASPSFRLDVTDNKASGASGMRLTTQSTSAGPILVLNYSPGNITNWGIGTSQQITSALEFVSSNTVGGDPSTAGTTRMLITSGGNVGIGTTTPNTLLNLKSSTTTELRLESIGGTYRSFIGFRTDAQKYDVGINLNDTTDAFSFNYTGTERMRISPQGYLKASNNGNYVNATASYHELNNNSDARVAILTNRSTTLTGQNGIMVYFNNVAPNNTTSSFIACEDSSNLRFIVYSNGNVQNTNNSYGAISDAKLKENIEDASPKLDDLMKVKVRNYNLIGDDKKQIGVIAQELEEVFPAMIDESEDYEEVEVAQLDTEGNEILDKEGQVITTKERVSKGTSTKSVKYSVFVPMLIKAMQELSAKIETLEAEIQTLKQQ